MRYHFSLLLALGFFCVAAVVFTAPAFAQEIKPLEPQQQPSKGTEKPAPTKTSRRGTPVTVQHDGEDELGARLALKLKETLNSSSLFDVSDKDEKKLKVIIKTMREFEGRPNSSSIYSLVWVYSESEATLKYFLDTQIGLINEGELESTAEAIAAATEKVGARYSYLFE
ncbi:hypothetical protein [Oceanidesulfovibrio marinus]|uniref:Uncharacterized protein n=1 Tax=Oceanidesulfovibrio marinus TaxID=370038 RepID=A0A6P1ZKA5_9BACT|nr:hypothetical protein [Oceanidesulfovibrio marinus]QJT10569.1 hypothetical protein E8L03_17310 [Oceanidesulfovibrio marinus]TVM34199.1 hypothetical protein DQK91_09930 [Oceanidesulfovibrio marinus]